eukprot:899733-Amphidinium_carterae.1
MDKITREFDASKDGYLIFHDALTNYMVVVGNDLVDTAATRISETNHKPELSGFMEDAQQSEPPDVPESQRSHAIENAALSETAVLKFGAGPVLKCQKGCQRIPCKVTVMTICNECHCTLANGSDALWCGSCFSFTCLVCENAKNGPQRGRISSTWKDGSHTLSLTVCQSGCCDVYRATYESMSEELQD